MQSNNDELINKSVYNALVYITADTELKTKNISIKNQVDNEDGSTTYVVDPGINIEKLNRLIIKSKIVNLLGELVKSVNFNKNEINITLY